MTDRLRHVRAVIGRFARWADGLRLFVERHWKIAVVLMVLLSALAVIQSYESTHGLASKDSTRIDTLFAQRDVRRHTLDEERYQAALNGCRRQNVARRGTNRISRILKDAFAPVIVAEKQGKVETPLVRGLALATTKLKILPITVCLDVIPNPDAKG